MKKETPMMAQYHRIKRGNKDAVLLFRLGDFYEMFEKDAVLASSILNIALTKRNGIPMCGFPHHAADTYIGKFLKSGKKVAICEQRGDPKLAKGIVDRDVVEIISPGVITDPDLLEGRGNNCIAAVFGTSKRGEYLVSCSSLDVSTGEFISTYIPSGDVFDGILNEIADNGIREIIYPESWDEKNPWDGFIGKLRDLTGRTVFRAAGDGLFDEFACLESLKAHFGIVSVDVFGFQSDLEVFSSGAVLSYVKDSTKRDVSHVRWVKKKQHGDFLLMDNATKRHLELTESMSDPGSSATLFSVLDHTRSAMGTRLLKRYIHNPSADRVEISERLQKVRLLFEDRELLSGIQRTLTEVLDVERIVSKLSIGKGTAKDLVALKSSLFAIQTLKAILEERELFFREKEKIGDSSGLTSLVDSGIVEDPPLSVRDGGFIKSGYDVKLDEYKKALSKNRKWIGDYQADQQKKLGIGSLKLRYNRIIGYYIEVTKPNLTLVPNNYIKKQTLVNAERFTTQQLQEHEILIMEAREGANELERALFENIRGIVLKETEMLFSACEAVARIDVFQSLAWAALENGYCMPEIADENIIAITDGRHPVIEKFGEERFIENDLLLDDADRRVMILTGPNMAGKSTFLRQAALIVIMTHIGSYVPAKKAKMGIVDRVFSRIGASDRLVKGESTFLVEMIETSRILHYATNRSFIIMDEIGRGTSTYDGLSIAWAVLEYLLDEDKVGAKALFATHYHEITALESRQGVVNYNVTVKEWNNDVIFLRKVLPGVASKSYGIEVARMAGIPEIIIERAKSILQKLESEYGSYVPFFSERGEKERPESQLDLFPSSYDILRKELSVVDIDSITPLEALNILDRLKRSI
ncbi:MAG: DNA mismatch repair protein MutS [Spirochaetes bacterium]|nr:DNA mismatch repair protein MutS [Spirochaetota bacterium]